MKLAAATIGLALAFSVTGAFAQGTAGSSGSAAGGGVGTSPGVSTSGSLGSTTTGTGSGSTPTVGGANEYIHQSIREHAAALWSKPGPAGAARRRKPEQIAPQQFSRPDGA